MREQRKQENYFQKAEMGRGRDGNITEENRGKGRVT